MKNDLNLLRSILGAVKRRFLISWKWVEDLGVEADYKSGSQEVRKLKHVHTIYHSIWDNNI